jgi:hypothetical protein
MSLRVLLIVLHLFIGLSAFGAAQALVLDPSGSAMTFDVEWLRGSPFPDYRFPGLFLAFVIGGTNLGSAFALAKNMPFGALLSLASGLLLVAWVSIQWLIIGFQHWTQLMWVVVFTATTILAAINARRDSRSSQILARLSPFGR